MLEKRRVPMLHEMYPKGQAEFMFWSSSIGVVLGGVGLLLESDFIFKWGVSLLVIGANISIYLNGKDVILWKG